jgi:hypothetical protein
MEGDKPEPPPGKAWVSKAMDLMEEQLAKAGSWLRAAR